MFLNKVFKFLAGYVILSLNGLSIERFINVCMHRHIKLLSISKHERDRAEIMIYMRDMKRIRSAAFKTRTRVRIVGKYGLPILFRQHGRRYVLVSGAAFVAALLIAGSQFVWIVDIEGADNINKARLEAAIELAGLHQGAMKSSLPSGNEMKSIIMSNTDDLSWAWVYIQGARAVVSVRPLNKPPEMIDRSIPCDVVALCDGVVSSVTAKSGAARINKGDAVSAGDVLIAGTIDTEDGYRTVHATGEVRARVFRTLSGEYSLFEEVRIPNGNNKMQFGVTLFSKRIDFFKNGGISSAEFDTITSDRYIDTPLGTFGISTTHATGVDVSERMLTPEEVTENALYELEEKISQTLTTGAVLISKSVRTEAVNNRTLRVILETEFEQNIGLEKEIRQKE